MPYWFLESLYKIDQRLPQIYNIMVSLEMSLFKLLESWRNSMNLFWWRHLEMSFVFLFSKFFPLDSAISSF